MWVIREVGVNSFSMALTMNTLATNGISSIRQFKNWNNNLTTRDNQKMMNDNQETCIPK